MSEQSTAGQPPAQRADVFAVPGKDNIIDTVGPDGLSSCFGETLDQVRQRYPGAVRLTRDAWRAQAIASQQTPIRWATSTQEQYIEMLEVLPPISWRDGAFLVGEAQDHCIATGQPRYQAYRQIADRFYASTRPLTVAELRRELTLAPATVERQS